MPHIPFSRIKASDARAIICWTITPAGVVFIKQAKQLGLSDRVIMHSYGFVDDRYMKQAEGAAEGIDLMSQKFPVGTDLPATDPLKQRIADITARFEKKFNTKPNQFVAQTYDAIYMASDALAKGGKDKDKVASRSKNEGFQGVGGNFSFSPTTHSGLTKDDAVVTHSATTAGIWRTTETEGTTMGATAMRSLLDESGRAFRSTSASASRRFASCRVATKQWDPLKAIPWDTLRPENYTEEQRRGAHVLEPANLERIWRNLESPAADPVLGTCEPDRVFLHAAHRESRHAGVSYLFAEKTR
jgi:hypothetical protein